MRNKLTLDTLSAQVLKHAAHDSPVVLDNQGAHRSDTDDEMLVDKGEEQGPRRRGKLESSGSRKADPPFRMA